MRKKSMTAHGARFVVLTLFSLLLQLSSPGAPCARLSGDSTLLSIDDVSYTVDDVIRWWRFYREDGEGAPDSADGYIDWLLLLREGEAMALRETGEFARKARIFLETRALMRLKYEEVDSKVLIQEEEIRKRYEQDHVPLRLVSLVSFKDMPSAEKFVSAI